MERRSALEQRNTQPPCTVRCSPEALRHVGQFIHLDERKPKPVRRGAERIAKRLKRSRAGSVTGDVENQQQRFFVAARNQSRQLLALNHVDYRRQRRRAGRRRRPGGWRRRRWPCCGRRGSQKASGDGDYSARDAHRRRTRHLNRSCTQQRGNQAPHLRRGGDARLAAADVSVGQQLLAAPASVLPGARGWRDCAGAPGARWLSLLACRLQRRKQRCCQRAACVAPSRSCRRCFAAPLPPPRPRLWARLAEQGCAVRSRRRARLVRWWTRATQLSSASRSSPARWGKARAALQQAPRAPKAQERRCTLLHTCSSLASALTTRACCPASCFSLTTHATCSTPERAFRRVAAPVAHLAALGLRGHS